MGAAVGNTTPLAAIRRLHAFVGNRTFGSVCPDIDHPGKDVDSIPLEEARMRVMWTMRTDDNVTWELFRDDPGPLPDTDLVDERGVQAVTATKMIFEDRPSYTFLPAARRQPNPSQNGAPQPPIHDDKRFFLVVEDGSRRFRYQSRRTYGVDEAAALIRRFGTLPFSQVERLMRKDGI